MDAEILTPDVVQALKRLATISPKKLEEFGIKLLIKLDQIDVYNEDDGSEKIKVLVTDSETTGPDPNADKPIEVGMVLVEYAPSTGKFYRILRRLNQLEDPGEPLSDVIINLTGITDDMVKGECFNDAQVNGMILECDVVLAHNSGFDRRILEPRFPLFREKPWLCSYVQGGWAEEGVPSAKMEYLAMFFGFYFGGHRAVSDCEATLHILAQKLPGSDKTVMQKIWENHESDKFKVVAINSPFETKDGLKKRGYRWADGTSGNPKAWWKIIKSDDRVEEVEFLEKEIYKGRKNSAQIVKIDAFALFSERE